MALQRLVNGVLVDLTPGEEAATLAEWAVNELPDAKRKKIDAIKNEALSRIQILMPAITDFDMLDLVREQWLSIAPAARNATVTFQAMIDNYQAGRDAIISVNALIDVITVDAYDILNTPNWPV